MGLIPGWGTKIPHAVCQINKIKQLKKKKKKMWYGELPSGPGVKTLYFH